MTIPGALRRCGLAAACAAAVMVAASGTRPAYVEREPVVERLVTMSWRDSVALRAPWLRAEPEAAMRLPQFDRDRRAFALDLVRTGAVDAARADTLATLAVREAYRRKVPPALVFGVMLVENDRFRSGARSSAGAVGLMQVHARTWVRTLGRFFGTDLRDDETNLRYGVYILRHVIARQARAAASDSALAATAWRTALLRYNGCVRGTNTPGCQRYPDRVRHAVEQGARALCAGEGFETCVARPLLLSVRDGEGPDPSLRLHYAGSGAADGGAAARVAGD